MGAGAKRATGNATIPVVCRGVYARDHRIITYSPCIDNPERSHNPSHSYIDNKSIVFRPSFLRFVGKWLKQLRKPRKDPNARRKPSNHWFRCAWTFPWLGTTQRVHRLLASELLKQYYLTRSYGLYALPSSTTR